MTGDAGKAEYQKSSTAGDDSQISMLRGLELDGDMHHRLAEYCKEKGILFLSTAFDLPSVDLLDSMGLDIFKIPSGEITIFSFLENRRSRSRSSCHGHVHAGGDSRALDVLVRPDALERITCFIVIPNIQRRSRM